LPIEPAFSFTSHACQGQTISKALADLQIGGFSAYFQASRVTSHICLTDTIRLVHLNKPLPTNLKKENLRLQAIEKNTLIKHGYEKGNYVNVPDIESEQGILIKINPNLKIISFLSKKILQIILRTIAGKMKMLILIKMHIQT